MRAVRQYLILALIAATVSGCQMMPLGPDLARAPSPFGESASIYVETGTRGKDLAFARITHTASGDTATVHADLFQVGRDFDARLTWYPFAGGRADLDVPYDYWLTGINILQSADRSAYVILRLPKGWTPRPGTASKAEVMYVTCEMMGFYYPFTRAKAVEYEAPAEEDGPEPLRPEGPSKFMSTELEAETCDFGAVEEVHAVAPQILLDADQAGMPSSESSIANYRWNPVSIRIP
jgi:hypothetical protein